MAIERWIRLLRLAPGMNDQPKSTHDSPEASLIGTATYLRRMRAEYDHHDTAAAARGFSIVDAQRLAMRQETFRDGPLSFRHEPLRRRDADAWLVWSEEHSAWWAPGGSGYASRMSRAGRFTKKQADAMVADANKYCEPGKWNEIAIPDPMWSGK